MSRFYEVPDKTKVILEYKREWHGKSNNMKSSKGDRQGITERERERIKWNMARCRVMYSGWNTCAQSSSSSSSSSLPSKKNVKQRVRKKERCMVRKSSRFSEYISKENIRSSHKTLNDLSIAEENFLVFRLGFDSDFYKKLWFGIYGNRNWSHFVYPNGKNLFRAILRSCTVRSGHL